MILITCIIKDYDKFYPQTFLEKSLYNEQANRKTLLKMITKELMPIAWHPKRWWKFCMSQD